MKRAIAFFYSILTYLIFFGSFLFLIGFLGDFANYIPKTVNSGAEGPWVRALLINLGLISIFGIQHSVMARKSFKKWLTKIVPRQIERSTYVLFSSLTLIILFLFWQPMSATVWQVDIYWANLLLNVGFWTGWAVVFVSTWMIDHFRLFGLSQVWHYFKNREQGSPELIEPGFYKYVRHPLMLGFLIAFWSRPEMSVGHLVFSLGMSLYILIGIYYEERDMTNHFGDKYEEYRRRVPRLFPRIKRP